MTFPEKFRLTRRGVAGCGYHLRPATELGETCRDPAIEGRDTFGQALLIAI